MIWWDFSSFVSKHEHDQTCIAQLFKLKCKNRMQLNTMTCVRASKTFCQRMSTVTGAIFPELCRATRLCGQSMEEIPPSPSCCYKNLSPSALSFFASSSPAWARRRAEEPQLQGARLWKGLTSFQNACCLDVQSMLTDLLVGSLWVGSTWVGIEVTL